MSTARSGRPRRRATAHVRATQTHCHLCGQPIDLTLPRVTGKGGTPHPLSSVVDEIIPVIRGGSITDPANLAHAHRICNGSRHDDPLVPWDPAWTRRTREPEEVRARCRHLAQALLQPPRPAITITW